MKKILTMSALALLPLSINAKVLTPAKTLQVKSPDNMTSIKDIRATLTVTCKYKAGILWPETKYCGDSTQELSVKDGLISIPQVETFNKANFHAQFGKNYEISLSVYEGQTYLANLTAYNEEAFKAMAENKRDLFVYRFNAAKFNVSVEGQDFFASDWAKNANAYVMFSVSSSAKDNNLYDILVSSSLTNYLWSGENKNLYSGKTALKDMHEITMPKTILAFLGEEKDLGIKVRISYDIINNGIHEQKFLDQLTVPAKPEALEEIGTLEFKAVK